MLNVAGTTTDPGNTVRQVSWHSFWSIWDKITQLTVRAMNVWIRGPCVEPGGEPHLDLCLQRSLTAEVKGLPANPLLQSGGKFLMLPSLGKCGLY